MANERSYEYAPPEFSTMDDATASTSCGGTMGASSTLGAYLTIPDEAWKYQWNTQPTPITDGAYNVDDITDTSITSYQQLECVSSIDNASTSLAGMGEASASFEDGATTCDDSFDDLWNAMNSGTDATDVNDDAYSGNISYPPMVSSTNADPATPTKGHAGMEKASFIPEETERNATATGGREQQELCGVYGNVLNRRDALEGNAMEHTGDTGHFCEACDQSSVKVSNSVEHCHNRNDKKHKCKTCDKLFHRADSLVKHYRTHTGERPYKCRTCDKSFRQSSHLDKHKHTHTNERPYKCQICNKSFRWSTHLDNHKRTHTGEKRYICKTCDKSFTRAEYLRKHHCTHAE
ncbi:zinc finger protein 22-like [Dermacentor albipictus]|uniref:zinc finger protein 22-like n=1 Tax=Dermacentor albipictus TaxID=60249 RepID=UPI0038FC81F5